jgi:FMN reductase
MNMMWTAAEPFIVGIGGTPRAESSTEQALRIALRSAERAGARTALFAGDYLARLPLFLTDAGQPAEELVAAVRKADGIILASPGYHGSVSGLVKNAIDHLEETAGDERVYLDGLPVGLIATAAGWQATGGTLATLRTIVHALRGWPTPLGVMINTAGKTFKDGECLDPSVADQLGLVGEQVTRFARLGLNERETAVVGQ